MLTEDIQFGIVLHLRGSRTKWRSGVGMDDGAGLPAELPKLD